MKINTILLSLIIFLASCSLKNSNSANAEFSFVVNEDCPNVCWLGIHPGTTSIEDAKLILMTSDQIKKNDFFQVTNDGLQSVWRYSDKSNNYVSDFQLYFNNDTVSSIQFNTLAPFTLGDFISLLGEPETIIIKLDKTIDGGDLVHYAVYFPLQRVSLSVYPGSWDGSSQGDQISLLTLNGEFTYSFFLKGEQPQLWLGYGHLDEYLPGVEIPKHP